MNRYHSFYLEDLEATIRTIALKSMPGATLGPNVEQRNANVAIYCSGIRDMAMGLIDTLRMEAEEIGGDE